MKFPFSLSVFFPAYNDAPSLPTLIGKTFAILNEHVNDFEVIVVNDGSCDDTAKVLEELRTRHSPHMRVITHPANRGYGGALRSGFAAAAKEFVFYTDGDSQYDVNEIPNLLNEIADDVGLVNGYKLNRSDPKHRIWIGRIYNFFARLLFGVRLRDIDCDFRLVRRQLLEEQPLVSTSGAVCVELVRKLELSGWRVVEIGVHHYPRLYGRSQFVRYRSLLITLYELIRLRLLLWLVALRRKNA